MKDFHPRINASPVDTVAITFQGRSGSRGPGRASIKTIAAARYAREAAKFFLKLCNVVH